MKICFLAAANSIHSYRWIKYFAEKKHQVFWISLTPLTIGPEIQNVNFYEIKESIKNPFSFLKGLFQVKKIIKKVNPDLLHAHYAGAYGLLGALTNFHPFVVTAWGSDVLLTKGFKKKLVKFVLSKADLLTCDGDNTTKAMISLGAKPEKIKRICFGTDVEKFSAKSGSAEVFGEGRKPNSKIKIISLRSLEPLYDIETLIQAAKMVLKEFSETQFIIAGDGGQKEHLMNLTKLLNIEKNIKFIGQVQNDLLPQFLQSAYIYVSTSLSDSGLAASTAEAMASGLPVIVTDSGDNKKWIEENKNGFVVPLKNPSKLAEKTIYLLKNKNLRESFGKYNRKIIEERNNYYKEMEKMEEIYKEITQ